MAAFADKATVKPIVPYKMLLTAFAILFAGSGVAWAGLPHWHRQKRHPYPPDTYAPQMRHYNVIEPVVVGKPPVAKHAFLKNTPPAGQVLWRQHVEAVPTYPWGWFGARRHVENAAHVRFYDNQRDVSFMRGD